MVTLCESFFQALACICLDEIESIYDPDTRGKLRYREVEGTHFSTTLSCSDLNSAPRVLKPGQCHFFNGKRQHHNSFFFPFVHHHYNMVSIVTIHLDLQHQSIFILIILYRSPSSILNHILNGPGELILRNPYVSIS